jgi:hypothetical protein
MRKILKDKKGLTLISVLVFGVLAVSLVVFGISGFALYEYRSSEQIRQRDVAFHIAEAGIHYYRWHLAHDPTDYRDGTNASGPYEHDYYDKDGNVVGRFSLEIIQSIPGSTIVAIESTGWTIREPEVKRKIRVRLGFPSMTSYSFLTNSNMNFGATTVVHGVVHSNGGIRFDGTTDSWVRSARDRYEYLTQTHEGIWGSGGPRSFWQYPVPAIDFDSVTFDMAGVKEVATDGGLYFTSSGVQGYHVVFRNNIFDLYKVDSVQTFYGDGRWSYDRWHNRYWDGDSYDYDIGSETLEGTYSIPANGAIFFEDNVWVEGVVRGRVTIASGKFPVQEPYYRIFVSDNLVYAARATDNVLGLLAQGDVLVPHEVPDTMEIDAAIISQYGMIGRPKYNSDLKTSLSVFGSQISNASSGWKYVNGWGHVVSGFVNTNHTYDANLKYYPPPEFPTGNTYDILSWEEF